MEKRNYNHTHAPKFYVRIVPRNAESVIFPDNFKVYPGSIYGRYSENGKRIFWVCDNYHFTREAMQIHIFNGKYWKNEIINANHPCYKWVVASLRKLSYIPKVQRETITLEDCHNLMKTNTCHKKGSGSRINTNQINNPLRWREVTELGHWAGRPASVVANSIGKI